MRRALKVAVWTAAFLGSAGIGAYIAANSDPFPPGVDRPTASPNASPSPSASPVPAPERWIGSLRSLTYHQLYVGGRCTTRWRGNLRFTVSDTGWVQGTGVIRLSGELECDFPIAQVQARRVSVELSGRRRGRRVILRLSSTSILPAGSRDYGGLFAMLPARLEVRTSGGAAVSRVNGSRLDEQGRGTFVWSTVVRSKRVSG